MFQKFIMANIIEQKVYCSEDRVFTVTAKIKDFKNKMDCWPNCSVIDGEVFSFQNMKLSLRIYPNGDTGAKGHVSAYLVNQNSESIVCDFEMKMRNQANEVTKGMIQSGALWGFNKLYKHNANDGTRDDEKLKIICKIKSLWINVENKTTMNEIKNSFETKIQNGLKRKYSCIESKVDEGTANIQIKLDQLKSQLDEDKASLLGELSSIEEKLNDCNSNRFNNVPKPRCPICLNEMSSNTKIAQCISGHLLCWPCKERMVDRGCALCDQPVNGRAFGLEAYLRTIFG